ncbi:MAG: hypothetical protein JWL96_4100 [Sphingomonas bacterium]|uniref:hypothetical protein n=1 Tax=Sphingomonas bacterium TaxID=1895847 RepID=UPI00260FC153|nr:hypothetical protein [Sphingomonas bacterium]MDB5712030.1 hypothetical protein [Sphingomonas bacterium]
MRACLFIVLLLTLCACDTRTPPAAPPRLILWAWERPEDLRFVRPPTEVAYQAGFVLIDGDSVEARGRHFPLRVSAPPSTVLVHVQIGHARPLAWSPELRARVSAAVLHFARESAARRVQIDFEVRQSERQALLEVLADVRRGLRPGTVLSMTALASWCMDEDWLAQAPVDEIVPMLFRMQKGGDSITKRLADGGNFRNPACRAALAISTDSSIPRAPPGRRIYLFNPRSWDASAFQRAQRAVEAWR